MAMTSSGALALYAGINVLVMMALSVLVVLTRLRTRTAIGTGGKAEMERAVRVHGNNVEYVPVALIAMTVLHVLAAPLWLMHLIGVPLTAGRIIHAVGLSRSSGPGLARSGGMVLTYAAIGTAGAALLAYALGLA